MHDILEQQKKSLFTQHVLDTAWSGNCDHVLYNLSRASSSFHAAAMTHVTHSTLFTTIHRLNNNEYLRSLLSKPLHKLGTTLAKLVRMEREPQLLQLLSRECHQDSADVTGTSSQRSCLRYARRPLATRGWRRRETRHAGIVFECLVDPLQPQVACRSEGLSGRLVSEVGL